MMQRFREFPQSLQSRCAQSQSMRQSFTRRTKYACRTPSGSANVLKRTLAEPIYFLFPLLLHAGTPPGGLANFSSFGTAEAFAYSLESSIILRPNCHNQTVPFSQLALDALIHAEQKSVRQKCISPPQMGCLPFSWQVTISQNCENCIPVNLLGFLERWKHLCDVSDRAWSIHNPALKRRQSPNPYSFGEKRSSERRL